MLGTDHMQFSNVVVDENRVFKLHMYTHMHATTNAPRIPSNVASQTTFLTVSFDGKHARPFLRLLRSSGSCRQHLNSMRSYFCVFVSVV